MGALNVGFVQRREESAYLPPGTFNLNHLCSQVSQYLATEKARQVAFLRRIFEQKEPQ